MLNKKTQKINHQPLDLQHLSMLKVLILSCNTVTSEIVSPMQPSFYDKLTQPYKYMMYSKLIPLYTFFLDTLFMMKFEDSALDINFTNLEPQDLLPKLLIIIRANRI